MKENLVSLFAYAIEFIVVYFFLSNLFPRKKRLVLLISSGSIMFLFCWIIFILFSNSILNTFLYACVTFLFGLIFFETRLKGALFSSLFLTATMMAIEFISMNLLSLTTSKDIAAYNENIVIYFLFTILNKTLYLFVSRIALLAGLYLKGQKNRHFPIFLLIYPICSMIILYTFWVIAVNYQVASSIEIVILISSIAIIVSVVLTFVFYSKTSKEIDELFKVQQDAERIKTDTTYYALLDSQNEILKTITHDEKNHLATIKALANNPEVNKYIDNISNDIKYHSMFGNTKNKFLDLLLNKYQSICDSFDIEFVTSIRTANLSFMEAPDMITLISNILDNAVEAAKQSLEKRIDLSINHVNNFDVLTCSNSCDKKPLASGKILHTTKVAEGFHGFGVKSIKKIAIKYNGEFDWSYNELSNEFTVYIAFFEDNTHINLP